MPGVIGCARCKNIYGSELKRCPTCAAPAPKQLPEVRAVTTLEVEAGSGIRIGTELEAVLGDIPQGSTVAVAGPPGAGKSTVCLQACASQGEGALFVSLEMGEAILARTAQRAGAWESGLRVSFLLEPAIKEVRKGKVRLCVVDSLSKLRAGAGQAAAAIDRCAKETGCVFLVLFQVTKAGEIRGDLSLVHELDALVYLTPEHCYSEKTRWAPLKKIQREGAGKPKKGDSPLQEPEGQRAQLGAARRFWRRSRAERTAQSRLRRSGRLGRRRR